MHIQCLATGHYDPTCSVGTIDVENLSNRRLENISASRAVWLHGVLAASESLRNFKIFS